MGIYCPVRHDFKMEVIEQTVPQPEKESVKSDKG